MSSLLLTICFSLLLIFSETVVLPPPCDSDIYCMGPVLDQVQRAKLYDDDKYFVDMKLKDSPEIVLSAFQNMSSESPIPLPREELQKFVDMYFEKPGTELETWTPPDWHSK